MKGKGTKNGNAHYTVHVTSLGVVQFENKREETKEIDISKSLSPVFAEKNQSSKRSCAGYLEFFNSSVLFLVS